LNFRSASVGVVTAVAAAAVCTAIFWASTLRNSSIVDEAGHQAQIAMFQRGEYALYRLPGHEHPVNAMLPGFHAAVAAIAAAAGVESRPAIRGICFIWSLCLVAAVWGTARQGSDGSRAILRTIQAVFLPNLFPFHFLIYTDVLAAAVSMAAVSLCVLDRPRATAVAAFAAAVVRQTNGLLALFLLAYTATRDQIRSDGSFLSWGRRWWPVAVGIVPLAAVISMNGRVGLDDPIKHPLKLTTNNLEWSLLECGLFFLPWHAWVYGTQWRRIRPAMVVGAVALAAAVLWLSREVHPWNNVHEFPSFLRNHLIAWVDASLWRRCGAGLAIAAVLVALAISPLRGRGAGWLFGLWAAMLLPQWNVDPRYHVLPLLLFTVLREPGPLWVEGTTALGMIAFGFAAFGSIWWFHGII